MSIKCVIFDFGNVIAFFDHRKACRNISKLSKNQFTENEIYDELFKNGGLEQQYDRGEVTSEEFLNEIKEQFNISGSVEEIQAAWCDIFFPNRLIIDLLERLKQQQYRLMLASNTNELHYQWFKRQFSDELELFDEEIISFKIGFRKPEMEFFDYCIDRSEFRAFQCVFIDDRQEFVEVARRLGMKGVWYTSIDQFPYLLEEVGIQDDFLLTEFANPTFRPMNSVNGKEDELSLTLYVEKYTNFRHFDTLRWQVPGLVFIVAGAIIGFAPMPNGYPSFWVLIVFGIFVLLCAWLMTRIGKNMEKNRLVLTSLAIRLGDFSIPKSPGKKSAAYLIVVFFKFLGWVSIGTGVVLFISLLISLL